MTRGVRLSIGLQFQLTQSKIFGRGDMGLQVGDPRKPTAHPRLPYVPFVKSLTFVLWSMYTVRPFGSTFDSQPGGNPPDTGHPPYPGIP